MQTPPFRRLLPTFFTSLNTRIRCGTAPVQSTESKLVLPSNSLFPLFRPSSLPLVRLPSSFTACQRALHPRPSYSTAPDTPKSPRPTFPSLPHQPSTMPKCKKDPAVLARERNVRHVSCQNVRRFLPSLSRRLGLTSPPLHSAESGK